VFVWLRPGVVGLMPGVLTGTRKGTDLGRAFSVGSELELEVVEVDGEGKRIRLAVPGAVPKHEAAPPPKPARKPTRPEPAPEPAPPQAFGTSLGDALREAMKKGGGAGA
jgi:hypothetical protein